MVEEKKEVSVVEDTVQEKKSEKINGIDLPIFYGVKAGMTRIFEEDGTHVPVTVIKLIPNFISQIKTKEKDGYEAYQIAYQEKREKLVSLPKKGHLKKANIDKNFFRFAEVRAENINQEGLGQEVSLESFQSNIYIDVTGISKGKGFQGVMKRFNFAGGPATHGAKYHRKGGSIGQCASPGRIYKNKKMPGHMGSEKKTVQNLRVVELNKEKGYMLVSGSVPGGKNSFVKIAKAVKK